ncbi:unnamed protein product [Calypogeia fissa]
MPSAQETREARRRKILARGSDRLAFITGELPSIPAPSSAASSSIAQTSSGNDITPIPRSGDAALIRLTDANADSSGKPQDFDHKDGERVIKDVDEDSISPQGVQDLIGIEEAPNLHVVSPQTSNEVHLTGLDGKLDRRGTVSTKGGWSATSLMTWDGIACAIDATENYRALGAVLLALISVVQGYVNCANSQGKCFSNWAIPWPVALVILTDISLVVGALLLGLVRIPSVVKPVDVPEVSTTEAHLSKISEISSQLECWLEVGTVIFKTTRALFLDCSIYAVTLITGYTLWQNWYSATVP